MVNLIIILNVRVKRVADTRIKSDNNLERKGQAGGRHQNKPIIGTTHYVESFFCFGGEMSRKSEFKTMDSRELKRIEKSIPLLHRVSTYFNDFFVGKRVIYCTQNNKITVHFSKSNFMHLCGINYTKGTEKFFDDCLDDHLDIDSIHVKKDGTTMQKLQILSSIFELTSSHVRLTGPGTFLLLRFDNALRTNKQILALTLKSTDRKIVPQSLLDLKKMNSFPIGEVVTKIYAIPYGSCEEIVYYTK